MSIFNWVMDCVSLTQVHDKWPTRSERLGRAIGWMLLLLSMFAGVVAGFGMVKLLWYLVRS